MVIWCRRYGAGQVHPTDLVHTQRASAAWPCCTTGHGSWGSAGVSSEPRLRGADPQFRNGAAHGEQHG